MADWWTAEQIAQHLTYPNGQRVFNSPESARSWIARRKIPHHPTRRKGPRESRLYDSDVVLAVWRRLRSKPRTTARPAADPD